MGARTVAAVAAALMGLSVATAGAASAGTLDIDGVTATWDDAQLTQPGERCEDIPVTWSNNTERRILAIDFIVANQDGVVDKAAVRTVTTVGIEPGETGEWRVNLCATGGYSGTAQFTLAVAGYPSRGEVDASATVPVALAPPRTFTRITAESHACTSQETQASPEYCSTMTTLRLLDGKYWAIGNSDKPSLRLYNRAGRVPLRDMDAPDRNYQDVWTRPRPDKFVPGKYLLVARNGAAGKWSCSVYYYDVCRWNEGFTDAVAYKFRWDGSTVSHIKRVPLNKIAKVRL